ncbi:hypothetical protein SprV_0301179500 [Sparganum proliferum]
MPSSTGMAAERFAALRQARDPSVDDSANALSHLALLAFPNACSFTAHFDTLKPSRGRLPTCSPDSLPILSADQVPLVAIEVTVPSTHVNLSTADSAPP